jgi:hypothetical protein
VAAFLLLKEAEQYLPGDPQRTKIAEEDTRVGYADAHRNLLLTLLAQGRTREAARSTAHSADRALYGLRRHALIARVSPGKPGGSEAVETKTTAPERIKCF